MTPLLLANAKTLWFVTRGSGVVALILLTCSMVLGVVLGLRARSSRWPRFAFADIHRNLTLLALAFVGVHVATTIADGYAPISVVAAFVPFASSYRPVWLGLGAISLDLLVALVATSLLRHRISPRLWRIVHWLAYAAWPVALVHSFGTGSDARFGWLSGLGFASLAIVALAVLVRVGLGDGPSLHATGPRPPLRSPRRSWSSLVPVRPGAARLGAPRGHAGDRAGQGNTRRAASRKRLTRTTPRRTDVVCFGAGGDGASTAGPRWPGRGASLVEAARGPQGQRASTCAVFPRARVSR